MDLWSATRQYAEALLLVAEVTEASTRTLGGSRFEEELKAPLTQALLDDAGGWEWADDNEHLNLIADNALTETVDFVCRRWALSVPVAGGPAPGEVWADLGQRLTALREALLFAVAVAERAWHPPLGQVLAEWIRERLDVLVRPVGAEESLGALGVRLRHAVVLCHRYRQCCYQLFGDRMWLGRSPSRWWCPDVDLAARTAFHAFGNPPVPAYVLRLRRGSARTGAGDLTVQYGGAEPAQTYRFEVAGGEIRLPSSHAEAAFASEQDVQGVVGDGLRALDTGSDGSVEGALR